MVRVARVRVLLEYIRGKASAHSRQSMIVCVTSYIARALFAWVRSIPEVFGKDLWQKIHHLLFGHAAVGTL